MIGYIIGIVLGVIIFLFQNFKPTSLGFRILFLVLSIAFMWGLYYAHLGYWNILIIPFGELVLCFLSAFFFPYSGRSAMIEYESINGENYYASMRYTDKIGRIQVPGLKQTYDRIMNGLLFQIVTNKADFQKLERLIYSKNFYPISIHTKEEVLQHINDCVEEVANSSKHGNTIRINANKIIDQLFNTYVSVMSIHEDATRNLEALDK